MTNWDRKEEREVVTGNLWRAKSWCHRIDPSMNHAWGRPRGAAGGSSFPQLARCPKQLQQGYKVTFSSLTQSGCTGNTRTWSISNTRYILSFLHTSNSTVIIWPYSQGLLTICLEGCKAWPSRALSSRGPPVTYPHDYNPVNPTKWKAGKKKKNERF